jgi:phosphoribosylamine--glycine ligase
VAERDGKLVVGGGRVLTIVSRAPQYAAAIAAAYEAVGRIHFRGMQYRTDIGARALAATRP